MDICKFNEDVLKALNDVFFEHKLKPIDPNIKLFSIKIEVDSLPEVTIVKDLLEKECE